MLECSEPGSGVDGADVVFGGRLSATGAHVRPVRKAKPAASLQQAWKYSLGEQARKLVGEGWWSRGDSNPRPHPCEGCALPTEPLPHSCSIISDSPAMVNASAGLLQE